MTGSFVKLRCECGNEQVSFDKAAQPVVCSACNAVLLKPTGGFGEKQGSTKISKVA